MPCSLLQSVVGIGRVVPRFLVNWHCKEDSNSPMKFSYLCRLSTVVGRVCGSLRNRKLPLHLNLQTVACVGLVYNSEAVWRACMQTKEASIFDTDPELSTLLSFVISSSHGNKLFSNTSPRSAMLVWISLIVATELEIQNPGKSRTKWWMLSYHNNSRTGKYWSIIDRSGFLPRGQQKIFTTASICRRRLRYNRIAPYLRQQINKALKYLYPPSQGLGGSAAAQEEAECLLLKCECKTKWNQNKQFGFGLFATHTWPTTMTVELGR